MRRMNYSNGDPIVINKVENGWIVNMPPKEEIEIIPGMTESQIRMQANIMMDELQRDKLLANLQESKTMEDSTPGIAKQMGTYIFSSFDAVLKFLSNLDKQGEI